MYKIIYNLFKEISGNEELMMHFCKLIEEHIGEAKLEKILNNENISNEQAQEYIKSVYGKEKWNSDQIKTYLYDEDFKYNDSNTTPEEMYILMNKMYHEHKDIHGTELHPDKAKQAAEIYLKHNSTKELFKG